MTPAELAAELRTLGPQDLNVTLQFIADRIPECRLVSRRLCDAIDLKIFLEELAGELRQPMNLGRVC